MTLVKLSTHRNENIVKNELIVQHNTIICDPYLGEVYTTRQNMVKSGGDCRKINIGYKPNFLSFLCSCIFKISHFVLVLFVFVIKFTIFVVMASSIFGIYTFISP